MDARRRSRSHGLLLDDLRRRPGRTGFLFLAGLGTALSGASRLRPARAPRGDARPGRAGRIIFGLAFVFRAQSLALGWGAPIGFLKVDILNVMGPALVVAAVVWGAAGTTAGRVVAACAATVALAMAAPLVRTAGWVDALPAPLQWFSAPDARPYQLHAGAVGRVCIGRRGGRCGAGRRSHRARRTAAAGRPRPAVGGGGGRRVLGVLPTDNLPSGPLHVLGRVAELLLPPARHHRCAPAARVEPAAAIAGSAWRAAGGRRRRLALRLLGARGAGLRRHCDPAQTPRPARAGAAGDRGHRFGLSRLVPRARRWVAALDRPPARAKRLVARLL